MCSPQAEKRSQTASEPALAGGHPPSSRGRRHPPSRRRASGHAAPPAPPAGRPAGTPESADTRPCRPRRRRGECRRRRVAGCVMAAAVGRVGHAAPPRQRSSAAVDAAAAAAATARRVGGIGCAPAPRGPTAASANHRCSATAAGVRGGRPADARSGVASQGRPWCRPPSLAAWPFSFFLDRGSRPIPRAVAPSPARSRCRPRAAVPHLPHEQRTPRSSWVCGRTTAGRRWWVHVGYRTAHVVHGCAPRSCVARGPSAPRPCCTAAFTACRGRRRDSSARDGISGGRAAAEAAVAGAPPPPGGRPSVVRGGCSAPLRTVGNFRSLTRRYLRCYLRSLPQPRPAPGFLSLRRLAYEPPQS